jgi:hypothetical protein
MDELLKLVVIWLSIDVLIISTGWYAVKVIRPLSPNWWRQVIADNEPENGYTISNPLRTKPGLMLRRLPRVR